MVEVELELQVRQREVADQVGGPAEIVEEVARHVPAVDRLQDEVETGRRQPLRRPDHGPAVSFGSARVIVGREACHQVEPADAGRLGVAERGVDTGLQLVEAFRKRRQTTLTLGEIARWQVEQRLGQAVGPEPLADGLRRMLVGEQEFDGVEPGPGSGLEPVEERHLVEHQAQVGGKARHSSGTPCPILETWRSAQRTVIQSNPLILRCGVSRLEGALQPAARSLEPSSRSADAGTS